MASPPIPVQCPACRFINKKGESRCYQCDAELPRQAPPPPGVVQRARRVGPRPRRPAPARPPQGQAVRQARRPPSRPSAARPGPPGTRPGPPAARPAPPPSRPPSARRGEGRTQNIKVGGLRRELSEANQDLARPSTRLVPRPGPGDQREVLAWLCCDPLPAIPLGPRPLLTVGRGPACDLVLPHKEVSRRHGVVKVRARNLVYEDEGSSNGTFLNGKRVSSTLLRVGDKLTLGPYEIEIKSTEAMGKAEDPNDTTKNLGLTSVSQSGPSAALSGRIEEVPIAELLQQLEFNKKTGTLGIRTDDLAGLLVVSEGQPMFARLGEDEDDEAVIAMAALREGRFVFSASVEPGERRMHTTLTAILLEASRRVDERSEGGAEYADLLYEAGRDPTELDDSSAAEDGDDDGPPTWGAAASWSDDAEAAGAGADADADADGGAEEEWDAEATDVRPIEDGDAADPDAAEKFKQTGEWERFWGAEE